MKRYSLVIAGLLMIQACSKNVDPGDANPTLSAFSPSSGLPGTVVTITGASLTNILSVKFNNTNAFFKYEGGDLSAVVPANATSGTISITTGGGSVTSSATFNVIQLTGVIPKSSVSAVMPNNNPVGWPILIKGANIDSIRGIKFGNIVGQIDTNFNGVLTTRVPNGVTAGPLVITLFNKYGDSVAIPFTVLADIPATQTPPAKILFKAKAQSTPHFDNTYINEANGTQTVYLGSNMQGNEGINGGYYPLTITALDAQNAKTISVRVVRATDTFGDPNLYETYTGDFVASDSPDRDRIIFWSEEGRQIVVSIKFQ